MKRGWTSSSSGIPSAWWSSAYDSTLPVTMDVMVHHTKAVVRGTKRALVISDLPFMSYQASVEEAVRNAGRLLQEAGAHGVKLEGGREVAEATRRIVAAGIPVMAHLGLTPQSIHQFGGYKVQGKRTQRHGGSWRTRRSWRRRGPSP